jgi:peptidoglycan/LPS O-acetylase OafA/YrhL
MQTSNDQQSGSGRYFRPELDVLRFVAFLMVFFHHILPRNPEPYSASLSADPASFLADVCGFGLPLFFFLSAYLITKLLLLEKSRTAAIHLVSFYVRRVLRIWPLYFLGLAIGVGFAILWGDKTDLAMFGHYAVFVGNLWFLDRPWSPNPMTPLWSLSIEEQFYLVIPCLLLWGGRKGALFAGVAFVAISIASLIFEGNAHWPIDTAIWVNTPSQMIFFGAGMFCAAGIREPAKKDYVFSSALLAMGAGLFFAAVLTGAKRIAEASSGFPIAAGYALAAAACAFMLYGFLKSKIAFPGMIGYLGKISYGLYVYHLLVLHAFDLGLPFAPAFLHHETTKVLALIPLGFLAHLSYRYFETPFLRLRRRFTFVQNRPL